VRPFLHLTALLALVLPISAAAQEGVLHLDEVYRLAQERNPRLQALAASARAAGLREPAASALPDPTFQIGFTNLSLPGLSSNMAMSMAPSVQLMQTLPFPGKLGIREEMAALESLMVSEVASEGWWRVRAEAADLFFTLYETERSLDVQSATLSVLEDLEAIAKALYGSGSGKQSDVLRASVEVARLDGDMLGLRARRTSLAGRLNALLDRPPETVVQPPVLPWLPADLPRQDTLRAWAEASRPLLLHARTGIERAGAGVDLANREMWPDLMLGLQYGQRDRGAGVERMGGAVVGFSVPIFAGSRQRPLRDAAEANTRMAEAELASARAGVAARLTELEAELTRTRRLLDLYREEILPQAAAAVASALSSYRVGEVDFQAVLDAQLSVNRYELQLFQFVAGYGAAVAALESQIGRALPQGRTARLEVP